MEAAYTTASQASEVVSSRMSASPSGNGSVADSSCKEKKILQCHRRQQRHSTEIGSEYHRWWAVRNVLGFETNEHIAGLLLDGFQGLLQQLVLMCGGETYPPVCEENQSPVSPESSQDLTQSPTSSSCATSPPGGAENPGEFLEYKEAISYYCDFLWRMCCQPSHQLAKFSQISPAIQDFLLKLINYLKNAKGKSFCLNPKKKRLKSVCLKRPRAGTASSSAGSPRDYSLQSGESNIFHFNRTSGQAVSPSSVAKSDSNLSWLDLCSPKSSEPNKGRFPVMEEGLRTQLGQIPTLDDFMKSVKVAKAYSYSSSEPMAGSTEQLTQDNYPTKMSRTEYGNFELQNASVKTFLPSESDHLLKHLRGLNQHRSEGAQLPCPTPPSHKNPNEDLSNLQKRIKPMESTKTRIKNNRKVVHQEEQSVLDVKLQPPPLVSHRKKLNFSHSPYASEKLSQTHLKQTVCENKGCEDGHELSHSEEAMTDVVSAKSLQFGLVGAIHRYEGQLELPCPNPINLSTFKNQVSVGLLQHSDATEGTQDCKRSMVYNNLPLANLPNQPLQSPLMPAPLGNKMPAESIANRTLSLLNTPASKDKDTEIAPVLAGKNAPRNARMHHLRRANEAKPQKALSSSALQPIQPAMLSGVELTPTATAAVSSLGTPILLYPSGHLSPGQFSSGHFSSGHLPSDNSLASLSSLVQNIVHNSYGSIIPPLALTTTLPSSSGSGQASTQATHSHSAPSGADNAPALRRPISAALPVLSRHLTSTKPTLLPFFINQTPADVQAMTSSLTSSSGMPGPTSTSFMCVPFPHNQTHPTQLLPVSFPLPAPATVKAETASPGLSYSYNSISMLYPNQSNSSDLHNLPLLTSGSLHIDQPESSGQKSDVSSCSQSLVIDLNSTELGSACHISVLPGLSQLKQEVDAEDFQYIPMKTEPSDGYQPSVSEYGKILTADFDSERVPNTDNNSGHFPKADQNSGRFSNSDQNSCRIKTADQKSGRVPNTDHNSGSFPNADQKSVRCFNSDQNSGRIQIADHNSDRFSNADHNSGRFSNADHNSGRFPSVNHDPYVSNIQGSKVGLSQAGLDYLSYPLGSERAKCSSRTILNSLLADKDIFVQKDGCANKVNKTGPKNLLEAFTVNRAQIGSVSEHGAQSFLHSSTQAKESMSCHERAQASSTSQDRAHPIRSSQNGDLTPKIPRDSADTSLHSHYPGSRATLSSDNRVAALPGPHHRAKTNLLSQISPTAASAQPNQVAPNLPLMKVNPTDPSKIHPPKEPTPKKISATDTNNIQAAKEPTPKKTSPTDPSYQQASRVHPETPKPHQKLAPRRRLICPICNMEFFSSMDVLVHRFEQHGHVCSECDSRFLTLSRLTQHKATDHPPILMCSQCRFHTFQQEELLDHCRSAHGAVMDGDKKGSKKEEVKKLYSSRKETARKPSNKSQARKLSRIEKREVQPSGKPASYKPEQGSSKQNSGAAVTGQESSLPDPLNSTSNGDTNNEDTFKIVENSRPCKDTEFTEAESQQVFYNQVAEPKNQGHSDHCGIGLTANLSGQLDSAEFLFTSDSHCSESEEPRLVIDTDVGCCNEDISSSFQQHSGDNSSHKVKHKRPRRKTRITTILNQTDQSPRPEIIKDSKNNCQQRPNRSVQHPSLVKFPSERLLDFFGQRGSMNSYTDSTYTLEQGTTGSEQRENSSGSTSIGVKRMAAISGPSSTQQSKKRRTRKSQDARTVKNLMTECGQPLLTGHTTSRDSPACKAFSIDKLPAVNDPHNFQKMTQFEVSPSQVVSLVQNALGNVDSVNAVKTESRGALQNPCFVHIEHRPANDIPCSSRHQIQAQKDESTEAQEQTRSQQQLSLQERHSMSSLPPKKRRLKKCPRLNRDSSHSEVSGDMSSRYLQTSTSGPESVISSREPHAIAKTDQVETKAALSLASQYVNESIQGTANCSQLPAEAPSSCNPGLTHSQPPLAASQNMFTLYNSYQRCPCKTPSCHKWDGVGTVNLDTPGRSFGLSGCEKKPTRKAELRPQRVDLQPQGTELRTPEVEVQLQGATERSGKTRKFTCCWPLCNKSFYTRTHLSIHTLTHTGEKPVACHICDYRCRQRTALIWHLRKHGVLPSTEKGDNRLSAHV